MKQAMNDRNRLTEDEQRFAAALKREPVPAVPAERIAAACRASAAARGGEVHPACQDARADDASVRSIPPDACALEPTARSVDSTARTVGLAAPLFGSNDRPLDPTAHSVHPSALNRSLFAAAFSCLTAGCAFFWIVLAFLLGGCVAVFRLCAAPCVSPLALLTTVSPVPVLSFWIRELYSRDEALAQLERTCRFSPEKLCFARLWGGMACNLLFTALAGALAFPNAAHLAQIYLCAFNALFFVGALALVLISFLREALPLSLLLAAWVLAASYLLEQQELIDRVMCTGTGTLAAVLAVGIGAFAAASVCLSKKRYAE